MPERLTQTAPYPQVLDDLVAKLSYRPGWAFALRDFERDPGSSGLTFVVTSLGYDTYNPDRGETYRVRHYFPVPPATFNERSWRRWLFDRIASIEMHEVAEFFQIGAERPFAPNHGPGNDPYVVFEAPEAAHLLDSQIRFDGTVDQAGAVDALRRALDPEGENAQLQKVLAALAGE